MRLSLVGRRRRIINFVELIAKFILMSPEKYRELQIASVTGNNGTTELEIFWVVSWIPIGLALCNLLYSKMKDPIVNKSDDSDDRKCCFKYSIMDFFLLMLPQIALFLYPTISAPLIYGISFVILSPAIWARIHTAWIRFTHKNLAFRTLDIYLRTDKKPYLSNLRAAIMLMVTLGILAVDFATFPRRLAKTETTGISLMDVGVGCIVASMGISSGRLYINDQKTISLWTSMKSTLPLLLFGFIRMFLVKSINYQEHLSEYGVHWNFFVTLGILPLCMKLLFNVFPSKFAFWLGTVIGIVYQIVLSLIPSFQLWLLSDQRNPSYWISLNKEGIFSLPGYLSLLLLSVGIGRLVAIAKSTPDHWKLVKSLFMLSGLMLGSYYVLKHVFQIEASRRLANLPFILFCSFLTIFHTAVLIIIDLQFTFEVRSIITKNHLLECISENQLIFFLLGNLITGVINLAMQTLLQPAWIAIVIICGYAWLLCIFVLFLKHYRIRFKL